MTEGTATESVRAALAAGTTPSKRELEHALRDCLGLSARQARKLLAKGYAGIASEAAAADAELFDALQAVESRLLRALQAKT